MCLLPIASRSRLLMAHSADDCDAGSDCKPSEPPDDGRRQGKLH